MYGKTIVALAAFGAAANASPLAVRQASAVSSVISSAVSTVVPVPTEVTAAVSTAVSSASSAAVSATSAVSSAASSASMAGSSMASIASSGASSAVAPATTSGVAGTTGNQSFPLYPCPAGYLLTYGQVNQTLPVALGQVTQAAGTFDTSPVFPNVTMGMGGNTIGATHTINLLGTVSIPEVLVNVTTNATSGYLSWTWNNTAPASAMGLTISNYSSVFKAYDPDYTTTMMIGNTTFVQIYTNACIMGGNQTDGVTLLETLGNLELANLDAAAGGMNVTAPAATTVASAVSAAGSSMASGASGAASSGMMSGSSVASMASSATSAAITGASSAIASVTSALASATSAAVASTSA